MALNAPVGFPEALQAHEIRSLLPPELRTQLARDLPLELKQRSFFISGIAQAEILQRVRDQISEVISGKVTEAEAQSQLKRISDDLSGTALASDARLKLVLSTNIDMARGYGQWKQGQAPIIKREYPAQEFYRQENRIEPRDWPVRWAAAGGKFYPGRSDYPQGRMIALKEDPIWVAISHFGQPYPPFDFNSGMGIRDLSKEEAGALRVTPGPGMIVPKLPDKAVNKPTLQPIRTSFSRTIPLPQARVTPVPSPAARHVEQIQATNRATADVAPDLDSLNENLQAKPEVEDPSLLSVLQSLFDSFAILGIDHVFREKHQPEEGNN